MTTTIESTQKPRRKVLLGLQWYAPGMHEGVAQYAREHNWQLDAQMVTTGVVPRNWEGDGVISKFYGNHDLVRLLETTKLPAVHIGLCGERALKLVHCFELDIDSTCQMAVEHFHTRGFRNFALAGWYQVARSPKFGLYSHVFRKWVERSNGNIVDLCAKDFTEEKEIRLWIDRIPDPRAEHFAGEIGPQTSALVQQLTELLDKLRECTSNIPSANDEVEELRTVHLPALLKATPKPLAILVCGTAATENLQAAAQVAGLRIPEDIAILGVDGIDKVWDAHRVPVSSVVLDYHQWGYEAAKQLDALMDGEPAPAAMPSMECKGVQTRKSTDIITVAHDKTAEALEFIRNNFHKGLWTKDVVDAVGLSRDHLDVLFRKHLGWSVSKEIERLRINKAKELLVETNMTIEDVAQSVGHGGTLHLHRAFRRRVGTPPGRYRRTHRK